MPDYPASLGLDAQQTIARRYGPQLTAEAPELERREAFAREVLGTAEMEGAALEIGCGLGFYTDALAERFAHVVALDRSQTQCIIANAGLYALGRRNVSIYVGTLPSLAGKGDHVVRPRPRCFNLVTSLDGLRRPEALDLTPLGEYATDTGMVLMAYPGWWFGYTKNDDERRLYEHGRNNGWVPAEEPRTGPLELLDSGALPPETVSLPYVAAMSGLLDLYDFKQRRPHPDWSANPTCEINLVWRLYHFSSRNGGRPRPDDELLTVDEDAGSDEELTVEPDL